MKIRDFSCDKNSIVFKAVASEKEFQRIQGRRYDICMFAAHAIDEPVKATRTGAQQHATQWLHLPARLKRRFPQGKYDFGDVKCGSVEFKDSVYFIYRVKKKTR